MFALAALIAFLLDLFHAKVGGVNLVVLGLVFVAAHLLVGWWPMAGGPPPWRRSSP